jgi:hypothetical protein
MMKRMQLRAQPRAVREFAAKVEDRRCAVCLARVEYEDRELFERTNLCLACTSAVNESLVWRPSAEAEA